MMARNVIGILALMLFLMLTVSTLSNLSGNEPVMPVFKGGSPEGLTDYARTEHGMLESRRAGINNPVTAGILEYLESETIKERQLRISRSKPDHTDGVLGYRVFGSVSTGRYLGLSVSRGMRKFGSAWGSRGIGGLIGWGLPLKPTTGNKVPGVDEVTGIIGSMGLPKGSLRGLTVFVLPMSMANTSGLSWPGVVVVGSRPMDSESVPNQLAFTVAHEIGHFLHYRYMGPEGSGAWKRYMRIRGIREWKSGGKALSADWESSVEETFAEDVRVLLAGGDAALSEHLTAYGDPRDSGKDTELRDFFADVFSGNMYDGAGTSHTDAFRVLGDVWIDPV